jgi:hypothetical protein
LPKGESAKRDAEIVQAIRSRDFSTVTVITANGQVVSLLRKSTIKIDKVAGKT